MSEVVFIGTGDAFGAGGRRQSATLVRGSTGSVLLDCGGTTGTGMAELGIERGEIDAILISHFHGDHFGGIPPLLLASLYEDERTSPLAIAGPKGIEEKVRTLSASMGYPLGEIDWSFPLTFQELPTNGGLAVGPVRVGSFPARHQQHPNPHGLWVAADARRIAYSGDTGWFDELPRHVGAADLFICECTYHDYEFEYHLNHEELLARRQEFACDRIVLTHLGAEMADRRGKCAFETADDGLAIQL